MCPHFKVRTHGSLHCADNRAFNSRNSDREWQTVPSPAAFWGGMTRVSSSWETGRAATALPSGRGASANLL